MKPISLIDVESTGLDHAKDSVIEVAMAIVHPKTGALIEAWSSLVGPARDNPSEAVNGIPGALLAHGRSLEAVSDRVGKTLAASTCVMSHNTEFDSKWFPDAVQKSAPWICTCDDLEWPKPTGSRSLTALALAHGLGVSHAHRALPDVLLLARLIERAVEMGASLDAMIARGMRPKARFISLAPFEEKDAVKAAGFHWVPERKVWERTLAKEDAAKLPFKVREVA